MFSPFSRLPSSVITCGAALCASVALLLQNMTACALWLEEHLYAMSLYSSARDVPKLLQRIGDVFALEQLDSAEKFFADRVAASLALQLAESTLDLIPEQQSLQDVQASNTLSVPSVAGDSQTVQTQGSEKLIEYPSAEVHDTDPVDTVRTEDSPISPDSRETPSRTADREEVETGEALAEQTDAPESDRVSASEKTKVFRMPEHMAAAAMQRSAGMVDALECALGGEGYKRSGSFARRASAQVLPERESVEVSDREMRPLRVRRPTRRRLTKTVTSEEKPAGGDVSGTPQRLPSVGTVSQVQPNASAPAANQARPQPSPPAVGGETPPMRCRILMLGDSLMEDLGPLTHRNMRDRKGLEFIISAKYSTGLCRPDYFNWPEHMQEVVRKYSPDLVIFFMGANDGMPIREGNRLIPTGGHAWRIAYEAKMAELVGIARSVGADIIWVELPAVGGRYNKLLHQTQIAQRSFCESHGITTLRTDPFLSGEWGRFEPYGDYHGSYTRLRTKDQTHFTRPGNLKVLEHLLPIVEQRLFAFYSCHPERWLSSEELVRILRVPAVYTCQYAPLRTKKARKAAETAQPAANASQQ